MASMKEGSWKREQEQGCRSVTYQRGGNVPQLQGASQSAAIANLLSTPEPSVESASELVPINSLSPTWSLDALVSATPPKSPRNQQNLAHKPLPDGPGESSPIELLH